MDKQYLLDNVINLEESDIRFLSLESQTEYKTKIETTEVDGILDIIETNFKNSEFQNKDLSPLIKNLTARQIPSRVKKLVESGHLVDLGGSPKRYKLA